MFDIAALAIQESTVLQLKHPATGELLFADKDEKKPITVTVASTSSRAYKQAVKAMHERAQKRGKKALTLEQSRDESVALLAACCLDSSELIHNGDPVKSESDFRTLLADDQFSWLRGQIDEALGDVELFIEKSLTN